MLGYRSSGAAESFIRTLKENRLWALTFYTMEELRATLVECTASGKTDGYQRQQR